MHDQELYQYWQEIHKRALEEIGDDYDTDLLFSDAKPTFIRKDITDVEDSNSLQPGLTRYDGLPDLPRGWEWPHYDGRAMDFLAQINLDDLEPGFHPHLPHSGWLYFFVGEWLHSGVILHKAMYFDGAISELERTSPPDQLEPPIMVHDQTGLVTFRPGFTLKPDYVDDLIIPPYDTDNPFKELAKHFGLVCWEWQKETSRIGGYGYAFQGRWPDRYALLYLNGFDTLFKYGYFNYISHSKTAEEREEIIREQNARIQSAGLWLRYQQQRERYEEIKEDLRAHTRPVELLFGLESTRRRSWVDAGFLQFYILPEDIAARNFDKTFCWIITT